MSLLHSVSIAGAVIAALVGLEWALRRRERRRAGRPSDIVTPDWSLIDSYSDLAAAAAKCDGLKPDQFLDGPFRRFLEMASDPAEHPRVRARTMEFGRHAFLTYRAKQAGSEADAIELDGRARRMAVEWFSRPEVKDGDYMIEVFDGISTHNGRACRG